MYFSNRRVAGEKLADQMQKYRSVNTSIVALSPGGVIVGEAIAERLHAPLLMLLTSRISAPGDASLVLGTIDQAGGFTYNSMIPAAEMEEYLEDARTYIEEEKLRQLYQMTSVVGENGLTDPAQIDGRVVILVTDGVKNGISFDAALHFLKRVNTPRVIGAIPVGPPEVIERLGRMVDELYYIYLPDNFLSVSHYYTDEEVYTQTDITNRLDSITQRWH